MFRHHGIPPQAGFAKGSPLSAYVLNLEQNDVTKVFRAKMTRRKATRFVISTEGRNPS